jgi:hypothetical protein
VYTKEVLGAIRRYETTVISLSWTIPTDDIDESLETGDAVFAVDETDDERTTVIADVSNDEAYLAMPFEESRTLSQWR